MTNTARRDGTAEHDASSEAMARHLYGDGDMDEERERIALAVATLEGGDVRQGADKIRCCDCQILYGDEFGFPDLVVPHEAWSQISPAGNEGGLLCPSCMVRRAHRAGVRCEATFRSGPFARIALDGAAALPRTDIAALELAAAAGGLRACPRASARFVVGYMEAETGLPFGDMIGMKDKERIVALAEPEDRTND